MKKKCSTCKIEKEPSEFYAKGKNKLQSNCKVCHNKYCINRWVQRKKDAILYKGGKCVICGYDKYYGALDFHHKNPNEKDMDWNQMRKVSWDNIKKELDKCDLVCSNCHREIHKTI